jgi:hypothetical protein
LYQPLVNQCVFKDDSCLPTFYAYTGATGGRWIYKRAKAGLGTWRIRSCQKLRRGDRRFPGVALRSRGHPLILRAPAPLNLGSPAVFGDPPGRLPGFPLWVTPRFSGAPSLFTQGLRAWDVRSLNGKPATTGRGVCRSPNWCRWCPGVTVANGLKAHPRPAVEPLVATVNSRRSCVCRARRRLRAGP